MDHLRHGCTKCLPKVTLELFRVFGSDVTRFFTSAQRCSATELLHTLSLSHECCVNLSIGSTK